MSIDPNDLLQIVRKGIDCIDKEVPECRISGINNDDFNWCLDLIVNNHRYHKKTLKEYFFEKQCSETFTLKILRGALNNLKNRNNINSLGELNRQISDLEAQKISRRNKTWYFIFPINLVFPSIDDFKRIYKVGTHKIQLFDPYEFSQSEHYYNEKVEENIKEYFHSPLTRYIWVLTNGKGKDRTFAFDEAYADLIKFLSITNYFLWINRQWLVRTPPKPGEVRSYTSLVNPSFALEYDNRKKFIDPLSVSTGVITEKIESIDRSKYDKFLDSYASFEKISQKNDLYDIIFNALEIFHNSLQQVNWDSGFLNLWTGLEIMVFKTIPMSQAEVIRRIMLSRRDFPFVCELKLKELRKKRNELVHKSAYNVVTQVDFDFIKLIYGWVLGFLIDNIKLNKKGIELFFEHGDKDERELREERTIINLLIKEID